MKIKLLRAFVLSLNINADVPAVMFSFPPKFTPSDEEAKEVGKLEPTRKSSLIRDSGEIMELDNKSWSQYVNTSPLSQFHVFVPPELVQHKTKIKAITEDVLFGGNLL